MDLSGKEEDLVEVEEVPGVHMNCCNYCSLLLLLPSYCAVVFPYGSMSHSVVSDSLPHESLDFGWN